MRTTAVLDAACARYPVPGGRRPARSRAHVSAVALALFVEQGFEQTTVEQVAAAAGIGRRTLFRYFPSKNDLPWGEFDDLLDAMAARLHDAPRAQPVSDVLRSAILAFNEVPAGELAAHRQRMRLLFGTPALVAHAGLRFEAWRRVIAGFVAERAGTQPHDLFPRTLGWTCLGLATAAYEQWLASDDADLEPYLVATLGVLDAVCEPTGLEAGS